MKTFLIITIAFLTISITCNAQWSPGPVTMYNLNTGNIGIGTTSPASTLHLYDNDALNNAFTGLTIEQGGTGNSLLQFLQTGSQRWTVGIDNANSQSFKIATGMGLGSADKFTILTSGNIGIGNAVPDARLYVKSTASGVISTDAGAIAVLENSNGGVLQFKGTSNAQGIIFGTAASGPSYGKVLYSYSSNQLQLWTNNAQAAVFNNLGNMGLGVAAPVSKMHVYENNTSNNNTTGLTIEQAGTGNSLVQFLQTGAQRWTMGIDNASSQSFKIATGQGLGTADRFTILTSGNVGIGTASPDQKLAVNGTIHSKSVLVDMLGWSDFVFKPAYKLPSLVEVQTYIDKNQHLPGVPSAADVEKNGVNLGEMNKILLQKVEELTLYLIELNKKVSAQQKELEQLKNKE
jgi:hypothetical protein